MMSFVSGALALAERIVKAGYDPPRVWKLYKYLRGEPFLTCEGKISRQLRPKGRKPVAAPPRKNLDKQRKCAECGSPLGRRRVTCEECGYDNTYALYLDIQPKKENK